MENVIENVGTFIDDVRRIVDENLKAIAYTVISLSAALFVVMWLKSRNN